MSHHEQTPASASHAPSTRQPSCWLIAALLVGVELIRQALSPGMSQWLIFSFGFVPVRFAAMSDWGALLPLHPVASVLSFFSYATAACRFRPSGRQHGRHAGLRLAAGPTLRRDGDLLLFSLVAAFAGAQYCIW
jgi:hypothetical protein